MSMRESMIAGCQKIRNKERLDAWLQKRTALKYDITYAVPRLFTAKNSTIMEMVK